MSYYVIADTKFNDNINATRLKFSLEDYNQMLIERWNSIITKDDSIFEVASEVKKYIKSIFGTTSPEFAQVKGIEFKKPK